MIYGLTGTFAAGKDTAITVFQEKGFSHYSLSDELRIELRKRNMDLSIASHVKLADEIRSLEGEDAWSNRVINRITEDKTQDIIISSIRAPKELERLENEFGSEFTLIWIDAPIEERWIRSNKRNGPKDNMRFEDFKYQEEKQMQNKDGTQMNLALIKEKAKYMIFNDGTLEDLRGKVDELCRNRKN